MILMTLIIALSLYGYDYVMVTALGDGIWWWDSYHKKVLIVLIL